MQNWPTRDSVTKRDKIVYGGLSRAMIYERGRKRRKAIRPTHRIVCKCAAISFPDRHVPFLRSKSPEKMLSFSLIAKSEQQMCTRVYAGRRNEIAIGAFVKRIWKENTDRSPPLTLNTPANYQLSAKLRGDVSSYPFIRSA